jgi:GT2 family glycosyltransferase
MDPALTIVVLTHNTTEMALKALADAVASAGSDLEVEEIIVDNGSRPDERETLAQGRSRAHLITQENVGFARGMNAGMRAATGRYVLLLNSDAFVHDEAVARLVAYMEAHPRTGVCGPKLLNRDGTQQLNAYRRFPNTLTIFLDFCFPISWAMHGRALHPYVAPRSWYATARPVAHLMGALLVVRAATLRDVGLLDEGFFMYLEETQWQERIARAGWSIDLVPDAVATHWGGSATEGGGGFAFAHGGYLPSLEHYRGRKRSIRVAIRAGATISLIAARAAHVLSPNKRAWRGAIDAYASVIRALR